MARIPYVTESTDDADAAQALADVLRTRGYASNFHRTLAHVPGVLRAFEQFSAAVRATPLDPALRELVVLRVSGLLGNEYEWRRHTVAGLDAGVSEAQVTELADWASSEAFDGAAKAVLAVVDAHLIDEEVDDAAIAALRAAVGEPAAVAVCVTMGWYLLVNAVITPLRLIDDDTTPPSRFAMPAPAAPRGRPAAPVDNKAGSS